jgi:hypothetical protein
MAENKKSFVLYSDSQGLINQLPDEVAGRLLKHIYAYVNDENPISTEILLNIAFEPIKMQLKRDLVKWENQLKQRSEAGKKSAELRALTKSNERCFSFNEIQRNPTDNVNVNVNVNDITTIERNFAAAGVITFDESLRICLFDENWKEDIERVYKVDKGKVQFALTEFKDHCATIDENKPKTLKQFRKHFTNWVRIKKQYQKAS